jgi:hypothetical protein
MTKNLTPAELGQELGGASHVQVLEWRRLNGWPCVRVGKTIVFTPEQVAQIMAEQSVVPKKTTVVGPVSIPGQTKRSARRAS